MHLRTQSNEANYIYMAGAHICTWVKRNWLVGEIESRKIKPKQKF